MFFGSSVPKISMKEFKKVLWELHKRGLSTDDVKDLEKLFAGDLSEPELARGISRSEFEERMKWLRKNTSKHHLSSEQIAKVEEEFSEKF